MNKFNEKVNSILEKSSKEYVIWGIPPNEKFEQLLLTKHKGKNITDKKIADKLVDFVNNKGATKVRIQTIDLSKEQDWMGDIGMK